MRQRKEGVTGGASVPDLARHYEITENTIYRWKSKFGGMEVSDAKKLRDLEQEAAMKEVIEGKW